MYSRAGAAYARATASPCRGMQVYKQLQNRFARSEGLSEGCLSLPRDFDAVKFALTGFFFFF